jgi:hypothetical protein
MTTAENNALTTVNAQQQLLCQPHDDDDDEWPHSPLASFHDGSSHQDALWTTTRKCQQKVAWWRPDAHAASESVQPTAKAKWHKTKAGGMA